MEEGSPVRIGMFGGSFDPPHIGHFICARVAAEKLGLQRLLVIPAARQPNKVSGALAPDDVRCEMIQALTGDDPLFELSRIEIERGGVSYSVETLQALARQYPPPGYELYMLIGADALNEINAWRDTETIFSIARIAVMTRPGGEVFKAESKRAKLALRVEVPRLEISSTEIRKRIAEGLPVRHMVGREVEEIIRREGLYG